MNTKDTKGLSVVGVVIGLLIIAVAVWAISYKKSEAPTTPVGTTTVNTNPDGSDYYPKGNPAENTQPAIEVGGKATMSDLISFSMTPGQEVVGKVTATGSVQNGYFFEANILTNILDGNKKLLRPGHGTATTEWMTAGPVSFTTTLDFTGLPSGLAFVAIQNDNPSDLSQNDKIIYIPVIVH